MTLFQTLNTKGITVVVVTHEPNVAACCHRTVTLLDGRIANDR